jgi:phosphate transport system substrate-binding protein
MKRALMVVIAMASLAGSAWFAVDAQAARGGVSPDTIVVDGSTTVGPLVKAMAEFYETQNPSVKPKITHSGSGNGARSLISGDCNIAAMSREMKTDEYRAALDAGVTPLGHVVALDGIAIIVHKSNPISGLTMDQVRQIYLGKITNWREVGGPNVQIVMISRDTNSGTFGSFMELVMDEQKVSPASETVGSNGAARSRVQTTPAAIAYVGLGFVDSSVKALEVGGVYPERETILDGSYPIARPLYLYTNGYPKLGSHLHKFLSLYLNKRGQEIIESIGFVPMTEY